MIREVFTCDLCKIDKPKDELYRRIEFKDKYNCSTFKYRPSHSPDWVNGTQILICKGCVCDCCNEQLTISHRHTME